MKLIDRNRLTNNFTIRKYEESSYEQSIICWLRHFFLNIRRDLAVNYYKNGNDLTVTFIKGRKIRLFKSRPINCLWEFEKSSLHFDEVF